jgi:L-arabinokinase
MIAVYVSGHGFGHSTRTAEVLRQVRERAPELPITVVTSAPSFLFRGVVPPPLNVRPVECDIGLVQRDALVIDEAGTAARWREFAAGWDELVDFEARWLDAARARLVLADIPPLAFAAAGEAGVPAVALGNFSWDWIYAHVGRREPDLMEAAAVAREAYGKAEVLLRLPFAGDLRAFRSVEDVPLVARRPRRSREEARAALGWEDEPTVLLSFGGPGLPGIDLGAYGQLSEYRFVLTGASGEGEPPPNLARLGAGELEATGLEYIDLVGAADVVVTKPGYGIVTDCIGAGTRMVYTDRGDFPEYPILSREMKRYLPAAHATNEEVRGGHLGPALAEVRARPLPERPRIDGATVAAERLLARLAR